jgi:hypothetical protein
MDVARGGIDRQPLSASHKSFESVGRWLMLRRQRTGITPESGDPSNLGAMQPKGSVEYTTEHWLTRFARLQAVIARRRSGRERPEDACAFAPDEGRAYVASRLHRQFIAQRALAR